MTDRFTVRAVVCFLGVGMLVGLIGLIWLVGTTSVKDAALLAVIAGPTGTALGSLGTLLARTGSETSTPVTVMNEPDDAIPTEDVKKR
jgi:hypothetical protein